MSAAAMTGRSRMESTAVLLESKSSPMNLLNEMQQLRLLGHLCDVTVSVEYQGVRAEFPAHKAVLAATSKFFKEVFLNEKPVDGPRSSVFLNEVQVADFASFLEFVYTARVEVEEDRVQRMLEIAEKFKCLDLSKTCYQIKRQRLESVLLELQSFSEAQDSEEEEEEEEEEESGSATEWEPPGAAEGKEGQRRAKVDKKKEARKAPYTKIRKAGGRLAGRKVFMEIPKRKYSPRLKEEEEEGEQSSGKTEAISEKEEDRKSCGAGAGASFKCSMCQKEFLYEKSFLKHMQQSHGASPAAKPEFRCETCAQTFANRSNLRSHQRHVHSNERRFPCELCGKRFKRSKDVRHHVRQVHEGVVKPRHYCGQCGKGLSSSTALRLHERTHTGHKPYGCPHCQAKFTQPSALKTHMRTHTGEKPFVCDECGASFADKGNLTSHKRTHTGERLFMCDVCGKHFATNAYLKCHKRCHLGAKPYKCEVCGKTFGLRASLVQHSKVHAETRPYFCEQCGKAFTQQGALRRHQRIHTGEKPYKCRACERTFTDTSTLIRHAATHDRNAHWRSFLIDLTQKKDHNWSKIETLAEADAGGDSMPEIWSVRHGELYKAESAEAAAAEAVDVAPGLGDTEDTDPILYV